MKLKKLMGKAGLVGAGVLAAGSAMAAAPTTLGELSSSVSFTDVGIAVLAIAGALMGVQVIVKGARQVMAFMGR